MQIKLKCPRCREVKRRLRTGALLRHRLTMLCPDCGAEMYSYMAGHSDPKASRHPNYFDRGEVPFTYERRGKRRT